MSHHVWYLTAPDGRVVGASAQKAQDAIDDGLSPLTDAAAFIALTTATTDDPTATRYEAAGYVLARGEVAHA